MDLLTPSLPFIESFQKVSGLLHPMQFLSILGTEYFYLALIPIIYWGVSRPLGMRVGALLLFSAIVNEIFKVGFAQPRPYWLNPALGHGVENSFGFPSGHAQNAFLIWTFLALQSNDKRLWLPLAFLLSTAISLSRVYLGVHFPADIIGGALIGLAILFLARSFGPTWMNFWQQLSVSQRILFAVFSTVALGAIYFIASFGAHKWQADYNSPWLETIQNASTGKVMVPRLGAFMGFVCGVILASRGVSFEARTTIGVLIGRFVIGFVGLAAFYFGLGTLSHGQSGQSALLINFIRYTLVAGWIVYGAPLLWGKLRLTDSQSVPPVAQ